MEGLAAHEQMHSAIAFLKARDKQQILRTPPAFREGRKTRTWVLNPDEIEKLVERLNAERELLR